MLPPGFRVKLRETDEIAIVVDHERIGGTVVYQVKREQDGEVLKVTSAEIEPARGDDS